MRISGSCHFLYRFKLAMHCASAPRGINSLYSPNWLNVDASRARCLAIIVSSPKLFEPECRTPEEIQLGNAFCRFANGRWNSKIRFRLRSEEARFSFRLYQQVLVQEPFGLASSQGSQQCQHGLDSSVRHLVVESALPSPTGYQPCNH